jgi:hypothetical protein
VNSPQNEEESCATEYNSHFYFTIETRLKYVKHIKSLLSRIYCQTRKDNSKVPRSNKTCPETKIPM